VRRRCGHGMAQGVRHAEHSPDQAPRHCASIRSIGACRPLCVRSWISSTTPRSHGRPQPFVPFASVRPAPQVFGMPNTRSAKPESVTNLNWAARQRHLSLHFRPHGLDRVKGRWRPQRRRPREDRGRYSACRTRKGFRHDGRIDWRPRLFNVTYELMQSGSA
jgi:hypothetical protein